MGSKAVILPYISYISITNSYGKFSKDISWMMFELLQELASPGDIRRKTFQREGAASVKDLEWELVKHI